MITVVAIGMAAFLAGVIGGYIIGRVEGLCRKS